MIIFTKKIKKIHTVIDWMMRLVCLSSSSFLTPLNLVRSVPMPFILATIYTEPVTQHYLFITILNLLHSLFTSGTKACDTRECECWNRNVSGGCRRCTDGRNLGFNPLWTPKSIFARRRQRRRMRTQPNNKKILSKLFRQLMSGTSVWFIRT